MVTNFEYLLQSQYNVFDFCYDFLFLRFFIFHLYFIKINLFFSKMNNEHTMNKKSINKPFTLKTKYNVTRDVTGKCKSVARTFITEKIADQEHWN